MPGFARPVSRALLLHHPHPARIPMSPYLSLAHSLGRTLHSTAVPYADRLTTPAIKACEAGGHDGADAGLWNWVLAGGVVIGAAYWIDGRIDGRIHPILVATGKLDEMTAHLEEQNDHHTKQKDAVLPVLASLKADVAVLMDRTDRKAEEEVENYAQEALQAISDNLRRTLDHLYLTLPSLNTTHAYYAMIPFYANFTFGWSAAEDGFFLSFVSFLRVVTLMEGAARD